MDSANIHQLHNHLGGSSSLALPSCLVGSFPNIILNTNNYSNGAILNPRQESEINLCTSLNVPMMPKPDLGFQWANAPTVQSFTAGESAAILNSPQSRDLSLNDLNAKLMIRTTSGNLTSGIQLSSDDLLISNSSTTGIGRRFNRILPSVNISNWNESSDLANSSSLDMKFEVLDVLESSRFSGNFSASPHCESGLFEDGVSCYRFDGTQRPNKMQFHSINKVSTLSNGAAVAKRTTIIKEGKAMMETVKPQLESRATCSPPFKVRKEKLGDRIAALQQLVAPFGKTDTASVLMEAIGYIKFLQGQVENLSVPYMKSNKAINGEMEGGVTAKNENEDLKGDLTSHGLCLVPLSYVTNGGGEAIWPPPHYGGAT